MDDLKHWQGGRATHGVLPDRFPVKTLNERIGRLRELLNNLPESEQVNKRKADLVALSEFVRTLDLLVPMEKKLND